MPNHIGALCTGLIAALKTRLFGPDFLERHRRSEKDFTRHRCLPFHRVALFLMNLVKRSLQDELDEFFKIESGEDMATREVTKSAFSQARQKLHAGAFIELNTVQVDYFYDHFPYHRWKGLRLMAPLLSFLRPLTWLTFLGCLTIRFLWAEYLRCSTS